MRNKRFTYFMAAVLVLSTLSGCGSSSTPAAIDNNATVAVTTEVSSESAETTESSSTAETVTPVAELTDGDRFIAFYDGWKEKYLTTDPYVTDEDQYYIKYVSGFRAENATISVPVTVSEAHGYGMLAFAFMSTYDPDAHDIFDGMVRYYNAHRSSIGPHLMSWQQCNNGSALIDGADHGEMVSGPCDSATDGDLDIAYALLVADHIWGSDGEFNYKEMAIDMINDIMEYDVNHDVFLTNLGDWSHDAQPGSKYYASTRCSDFILNYYPVFAQVTGDDRWMTVYNNTYALVEQMLDDYGTGFLPDFIVYDVENKTFSPAEPGFLEDSSDGRYGYNSCRTPWRIGLDAMLKGDDNEIAMRFASTINETIKKNCRSNPSNIMGGYYLSGPASEDYYELCFSCPFLITADAVGDTEWASTIRRFTVRQQLSDYYGDSIKLQVLIIDQGYYIALE